MRKFHQFCHSELLPELLVGIKDRPIPSAVPPHWHDFYEIEIYVSGNGSSCINGTWHPIKPNTLCFFTPYDVHAFHPDPGEELYVITFMFDINIIGSSLMNEFAAKCHCFFCQLDGNTADAFVRTIKLVSSECTAKKYLCKENVQLLTSSILINLLRVMPQDSFVSPFQAFPHPVQRALFYIHSHFKEMITLGDVAEFVGFSQNHTSKLFRENLGICFKEYLTNLRLQCAEHFLLLSDDPITDIAYSSGFGSLSQFIHVFQKKHNVSPLQYRKSKTNTR